MRPPKFHFKPAQWVLPVFKSQPQNSLLSFHRTFLISQPNIFLTRKYPPHPAGNGQAHVLPLPGASSYPARCGALGWVELRACSSVISHAWCVIPASEQLLHTADISTTWWYCGGIPSKAEMLWHREDGRAHIECRSSARRAQTSEAEQCHQAVQECSFPSCEISGIDGRVLIMLLWCPTTGVLRDLWCPFERLQVLLPCLATRSCEAAGKVAWTPWGLGQALACSGEDKGKLFSPLSSLHIHSVIWLQSCRSVYLLTHLERRKRYVKFPLNRPKKKKEKKKATEGLPLLSLEQN